MLFIRFLNWNLLSQKYLIFTMAANIRIPTEPCKPTDIPMVLNACCLTNPKQLSTIVQSLNNQCKTRVNLL